jgi:hypothetical protein
VTGEEHLVPLSDTGWSLWRDAVLRTTGFPADGLDRLAAPGAAEAADAHLAGRLGADAFADAYAAAVGATGAEVFAIAHDPLFREAVTWQNRTALHAIDAIRRQGTDAPRNSQRRTREEMVGRYWQRYCAKNETIGFFGPVCWVRLDARAATSVRPGPALVRGRRVYFEHWALAAYAESVAADPLARRWLAPSLPPHLFIDGRRVLRPVQPAVVLSAAEAALVARCDGRRPAIDIAQEVAADPDSPLRNPDDGLLLLARLADRGLIRWDLNIPVRIDAEDVLARRLAAIGDPAARGRALTGLHRLQAARDAVARGAGDPDALLAAYGRLDDEFTALTGQTSQRRAGQMYAGRMLCVEECTRDLDVVIGEPVLAAMAPPLAILLRVARWLSCAAADAYLVAFRGLYAELTAELGVRDVPLGQLWFLAQGLFFDASGDRPIDGVAEEFGRRWEKLFGLDRHGPDVRSVVLDSADLADAAVNVFPASAPGWAAARVHGPDVHICAESAEAVARGEFSLVLGELHTAWATLQAGALLSGALLSGTPEPERLRAALLEDVGPGRLLPLLPTSWPRYSARLAGGLDNSTDWQLGFAPAPGADPGRLLPLTTLTVSDVDGELVVRSENDRRWPLIEFFAELIAIHTQGAFKFLSAAAHSPRISIDRMVVARETWRTTVGATGLADVAGEREQYLAVRRWRAGFGLPERVFVALSTETKPSYVDLTSPVYVGSFVRTVRAARRAAGDGAELTVTEMLPTPAEAWIPDAAGRRYFSELRVHAVDPEPARRGGGS